MSRKQRIVDRRLAKALLILQLIMIPIAAGLAWLIHGVVAAKSAFLGAFVYWLASSFFAWQAFKSSGARASREILGNMYVGLMGKFFIVVVGLVLILYSIKPINMVAVLGGFLLIQAMSWVAPFWVARKQIK